LKKSNISPSWAEYLFRKGVRKMKKKKITKKPVKRAAKPKGPVYLCRSCGMELVITKEGAGITNLVCCNQMMEKK